MIYKLLSEDEWLAAQARGVFEGSAVDRADGYIHFSTAAQAQETARRHFRGLVDTWLLDVDPGAVGALDLRWEPSRGGELFPHLYGVLPAAAVRAARRLSLGADGAPVVILDEAAA